MSELPGATLRTRTEDDLDVLYRLAADLGTWEERNPSQPGPLTRAAFNTRLARTAESDLADHTVSFVIDVDGAAVGSAGLFGFDAFARHAEAGISLVPEARGRGVGRPRSVSSSSSGLCVATCAASIFKPSRRTEARCVPMRRRVSWLRVAFASTPGFAARTRTSC